MFILLEMLALKKEVAELKRQLKSKVRSLPEWKRQKISTQHNRLIDDNIII